MAALFHLVIVSPVGKAYEGDVEYVSAAGAAGDFGIQAHHAPFVTTLKKGNVHLKSTEGDKTFVIDSGILEMNKDNKCLILSNKIESSS